MDGKNTTYGALVEAVERYVNGSAYPSVDDICLILGIEMKKVKKCTDTSVNTAERT